MKYAAYLMLGGQVQTARAAVEQVTAARPRIGLKPEQMAVLERLESGPLT